MARPGYKAEYEARKALEAEGYEVFSPQKTSRFGKQDIFIFDIVAINNMHTRFIQVKKSSTQGFLKRLKSWSIEHPWSGTWELWVRMCARGSGTKWKKYTAFQGLVKWEYG